MRFLFAPFGILSGLIAGKIAQRVFTAVWERIEHREAPEPAQRDVSWGKLIASLLLEGAIARGARGAADRGARTAFYRTTGAWPGDSGRDAKA